MSTNATVLVVGGGGGGDDSVEVCAGTEVPLTADVVGGVGVFVGTVVRGGETVGAVAGLEADVELDRIVGGLVTIVSTGVPDDADVGADEPPSSLHPATATASSATSTTLDREIICSIMSSWASKVPATRDDGARLAIVNFTIHTDCCST